MRACRFSSDYGARVWGRAYDREECAALKSYLLRLFGVGCRLVGKECRYLANHALDLVCVELRIHRQRQNFRGHPLANWKTSRRILKMAVHFLELNRTRILHAAPHSRSPYV